MANPYRQVWKEVPPGYYADPAVKQRYLRRLYGVEDEEVRR